MSYYKTQFDKLELNKKSNYKPKIKITSEFGSTFWLSVNKKIVKEIYNMLMEQEMLSQHTILGGN